MILDPVPVLNIRYLTIGQGKLNDKFGPVLRYDGHDLLSRLQQFSRRNLFDNLHDAVCGRADLIIIQVHGQNFPLIR
ncbi:hypothetical protein D3C71_1958040 [compost metagenome]